MTLPILRRDSGARSREVIRFRALQAPCVEWGRRIDGDKRRAKGAVVVVMVVMMVAAAVVVAEAVMVAV